MEEIKEEAEKVSSGLSKVISDASEIVMERSKNPYITAFSISWVVFNWKPIAFFIFSKEEIKGKIGHITKNYSDISHCLYYPLASAIIFLFLVPYLNQINEWFLRFSIKKRAEYVRDQIVDKINRDTSIAIAEDNKQKAIQVAREGENHNKYINELNVTVKKVTDDLILERTKNVELINNHNEEMKNLDNEYHESLSASKEKINQLTNINASLLEAFNNSKEVFFKIKSLHKYNDEWKVASVADDPRALFDDAYLVYGKFIDLQTEQVVEPSKIINLLNDKNSKTVEFESLTIGEQSVLNSVITAALRKDREKNI